jgi:spore coat polysaccharide biosynthesis protein SpsF (cytidylyltransferase family)
MMTVVAMIAARMGSTRFPGKVLADLGGVPVLQWVIDACNAASLVDHVQVCTSIEPRDDAIYKLYPDCYRGSEDNVLDRFASCARDLDLAPDDLVLRITGDCCFADSRIIDEVIMLQRRTGCTYANNVAPPTYPDGLDVQCITVEALYEADKLATRLSDRSTVVEYIGRHRLRYPCRTLICPIPGLQTERWVLDTEADYKFCQAVAQQLMQMHEAPNLISILDILYWHPQIRAINAGGVRNERFFAAIASQDETSV